MNDTALPPLDTLIHLGAGRCQELDIHLAQQPAHLVLVEADPDLAEALRARTAQWPQVKVIEAAIAAEPGSVTLQRYNLVAANSLRPATGLLAIYPGLKSQPALALEAVTPASIFATCALGTNGRHLLIVDLPGEELPVLQSVLASGHLDGFSELQVYCGHEPLYEGSATAKTMLAWLNEQGFDLIAQRDEDHPHRPCWLLKRNPLVEALKAARAEAEKQTKATEQAKAEADKQAKAAEHAKAEADRHAKLAAERAEQLEQRARANEQTQARLDELTKTLEAAQAEIQKQTESAARHQAEADKQAQQAARYKAEADKQAKAAEQAKAEADRHAKLAAERAEQLEHSQQAQAALQRDNALALRLQQLRETDLKDLQQRYAQVVEQKAQQERLLKQLTERLTAASAYLHQLEQQAKDHPPQLTEKAGKSDKHNSSNRSGKPDKHNKSSKPNKPNKKRRA